MRESEYVDIFGPSSRRQFLIAASLVVGGTAIYGINHYTGGSKQGRPATTLLTTDETTVATVNSVTPFESIGPVTEVSPPVGEAPTTIVPTTTTEAPITSSAAPVPSTTDGVTGHPPAEQPTPPQPEFKVSHVFSYGSKIGNLAVFTVAQEPNFPISWPLYFTDNPNKPQKPLQVIPPATFADYYAPYIDNQGGPGRAGMAGDSLFPGEKVAHNPNGTPAADPTYTNRDTEVFGHRTSHGAPFYHLDKIAAGDLITVNYDDQPDDQGLTGKQVKYRVIPGSEGGHTIVPAEETQFIRNQSPDTVDLRNVLTLYACHPPHSVDFRIVVKALLEEDTPNT
jgi:hypothetical protein